MMNKLFLIIAALALSGQAMAREPYLNGGHFTALDNEWKLEQPAEIAKAELGMSPLDIAASKCDWLAESKLE